MTESIPEHREPGRDEGDSRGAEVIAFPGADDQPAAPSMEVTEVAPTGRADEVLDGEIVDDRAVHGREVVTAEAGPTPAQILHAYWRRTRPALRPDRLTWAIARHELYYGGRGLMHALPPLWRWVTAAELDGKLATDPALVLQTRKTRRYVLLATASGTGIGGAAAWVLLSPAAVVAAVLAVLTVAGAVERSRSRTALEGGDRNREGIGTDPSSRDLKDALSQVKGMGRPDEIRVIGPIVRDEKGMAWTALVQPPPGVTAKKVIAKREEIAGAFDVAVSQLHIDPVKTSEGRVKLWCADEDPLEGPPVLSPLIGRTEPVDVWTEKVHVGTSPRGGAVAFGLTDKSGMVTGGESGSGKSVADDQMLCTVALDPYAQLWLADAKMVELEAYRPIAHEYLGEGDRDKYLGLIQRLMDEMERRYAAMAKAGITKITGKNWRKLDAPFVLFHTDEIQLFTLDDKGNQVAKELVKLASRCRAAGMFVSVATQKPEDRVIPSFLRDTLTMKLGMRCTTPEASDTILGRGMAAKGYSAAAFTDEQKGAGWLKGEGGWPTQLRSGYLQKPDLGEPGAHHVRDIVTTATELRAKAGTLPTGDHRPEARLLAAMIAVVEASGQRNLHTTEHLLPALAQRLPETAGWGPEELAAALPEGVRPGGKNVRAYSEAEGRDMSRPGYRLADLQAARDRL